MLNPELEMAIKEAEEILPLADEIFEGSALDLRDYVQEAKTTENPAKLLDYLAALKNLQRIMMEKNVTLEVV